MASSQHVKFKFIEHFNSAWVQENCECIATRHGLESLYHKLVSNRECISCPQQAIHLKGPPLPDFERESPSQDEQEHLINTLLQSQLAISEIVCSNSPFAHTLQKRLAVLQRIYHATSSKFHDRWNSDTESATVETQEQMEEEKPLPVRNKSGNEALVEMGIKTGLSLLFSLLKQNWILSSQSGEYAFCNDVLRTAVDIVSSLPPLSLANESKLTSLGIESLNQVTSFLNNAAKPQSGADLIGQQLASELVLALAAQRGSLRYLLEWIEMALIATSSSHGSKEQPGDRQEGTICRQFFVDVLKQMTNSMNSTMVSRGKMFCLQLYVHLFCSLAQDKRAILI